MCVCARAHSRVCTLIYCAHCILHLNLRKGCDSGGDQWGNVERTSWEKMMCWSVSPTNSLESGLEDRPEGDRHLQAAFLKSTDSSLWAHGVTEAG